LSFCYRIWKKLKLARRKPKKPVGTAGVSRSSTDLTASQTSVDLAVTSATADNQPIATVSVEDHIDTTVEYEDEDLDELADNLRAQRLQKTNQDVWNRMEIMEQKINKIEPIETKILAIEKKLDVIEGLLKQLVPPKPEQAIDKNKKRKK